jgi:hypothetical protein
MENNGRSFRHAIHPVIAGLDPAIHRSSKKVSAKKMDARVKPAHDGPHPGHTIFSHLTTSNNTHLLVPAARFCARAFVFCFAHPHRGVGGAPRVVRVLGEAPVGPAHLASKTRVNALMTRQARRLARRLASHDAGRSPLGAPPWRFWAPGAALLSPLLPSACASAGQRIDHSEFLAPRS